MSLILFFPLLASGQGEKTLFVVHDLLTNYLNIFVKQGSDTYLSIRKVIEIS